VLDLCAAPGGKSTRLAAAMAGKGTLVCNEIVPARAKVLSRNLERMGAVNALAVSADPAQLAGLWPALFDPCWSTRPAAARGCSAAIRRRARNGTRARPHAALRQRKILESACALLRPGGRLCYSTCTFSREENEETVAALLSGHPELEPAAFAVPVGPGKTMSSKDGCLRLYPHEVRGEGHFAALMTKTGPGTAPGAVRPAALMTAAEALAAPDKASLDAYAAFAAETLPHSAPVPNAVLGDTLLFAPPLPSLRGVRVLRAGLSLGQRRGRVFVVVLVVGWGWGVGGCLWCSAGSRAGDGRAGLPAANRRRDAFRGLRLPARRNAARTAGPARLRGRRLRGLKLGWVKASDGQLKNHYPKGLRLSAARSDKETCVWKP
jgi:hypothetical protein